MRLLIFSDTHLGPEFDQETFDYLQSIIQNCDQVIINGDFWDRYLISFDDFIHSNWSALFPLLLSKQAIYIYGNHDEQKYSDHRVNLFSIKQDHVVELEVDGLNLHFEHGHHIALLSTGDEHKLVATVSMHLESFARDYFPGQKITNLILQGLNNKMISWAKTNLASNQILVCGHTHIQQKAVQDQFLNSGLNCYGFKQFITITDGVIAMHNL